MVASASWRRVEIEREMGPLRASVARYRGGARLPLHAHGVSQVFFVLEGQFVEHARSSSVCRAGMTLFHPAGEQHSEEIGPAGARCVNVEIDGGWLAGTLGDGSGERLIAARVVVSGDGAAARRLARAIEDGDVRARAEAAAIVLERLARAATGRANGLADRAAAWLREHWARGSVAEMARAVGANPGHAARAFRARHGVSPRAYLAGLRMERACAMLEGGARVSEAARACGFADGSHLAHAMGRTTGRSPREWRRAGAA